jgi:hypothetical protein
MKYSTVLVQNEEQRVSLSNQILEATTAWFNENSEAAGTASE